jgi:hypothetical protein
MQVSEAPMATLAGYTAFWGWAFAALTLALALLKKEGRNFSSSEQRQMDHAGGLHEAGGCPAPGGCCRRVWVALGPGAGRCGACLPRQQLAGRPAACHLVCRWAATLHRG